MGARLPCREWRLCGAYFRSYFDEERCAPGIAALEHYRAGKIDGECQSRGIRIPLSDLLIGVTALELGFDVATTNLRHFHLIPGLSIVPF